MHRSALVICALLLAGFCPALAEAPPHPAGITIDDFRYVDTSGEVADQTAVHQRRLQAFMAALRKDVAADGSGAGIRIVGGIRKMSTLVQWAKVAVIDVGANRVLSHRLYTFRGDNDEAWDRARAFMSEDIRAVLAAAAASPVAAAAPIGIAVFDFELEDTSAAASASGVAAADAAHLAEATGGVRELLAQSGRYHLIGVGSANADATRHALRDCNGCDAGIARELGADQSLVGVVRRVSRTEYTIGFQLRDARSGVVVARGDSGLRMGADYSWARGAVRLVRDRLLENQPRQ
jgi:uncharacterized protein DUF2380